MQTAQAIVENHQNAVQMNASSQAGGVSGWLAKVFGCWHKEMSRPFSIQGQTYRTCLDCGARRQFNLGNWEMQGGYYYGRPRTQERKSLRTLAAQHLTTSSQSPVLSHVNG